MYNSGMKAIPVALLLLVSFATSFGQTPEATVEKFINATNAKKFDQMEKLVKGSKLGDETRKFLSGSGFPSMVASKFMTKITGDSAKVTMLLSMPSVEKDPKTESVQLIKAGGSWLLVPEKGNRGSVNTTIRICVEGLTPIFAEAKEAALATQCMSNLKQVCLGMIMFAVDNDDVLKLSQTNWQKKISPYLKNLDVLNCSVSSKNGPAFAFNAALASKSLVDIDSPSQTVMLYEGKAGKLAFHPDGKAAVGFADGHVKRVTKAEAAKLRWKP